jgi:ribokinase
MTRDRALFAGDVSIDLTLTCARMPAPDEKVNVDTAVEAPGGVAANAAVACALAGTASGLLVSTGDDGLGDRLVGQIRARGVEVFASVNQGPTCRVVIILEPHGEKRLLLHPGVSMFPSGGQLAQVSLENIGWFHSAIYNISDAKIMIDRCREQQIPWSFDLEPSTFPSGIDTLAELIDGAAVLFCNARAIETIGTGAVARLLSMGAASVVETRGAVGVRLHTKGGFRDVAAPAAALVVDTTGAGDCLAGWFISERLRGIEPEEALRTATAAATLSCQGLGAQSSYPTRADLTDPAAWLTQSSRPAL